MIKLVILLLFAFTLGCNNPSESDVNAPPELVISGETMGTTYMIRFSDLNSTDTLESIQTAVDQELVTVNQQMSTYIEDSELSLFNSSTSNDWISVSKDLASVVQLAQQINEATDGKYDVTVGPLVNLWNFGPHAKPHEIPNDNDIEAAKSKVGYQHLSVRLDPPALRKDIPDLYLDLSSIAKGHGVDRIASLLDSKDIPGYMIEIGGEVRTKGVRSDKRFWRIGVENPASKPGDVIAIVPLEDQALASSGDYRNYFEVDGKSYSHTIDPTTGRPIVHETTSVSVIADTCAEADAWATAILVVGAQYKSDINISSQLGVLIINRVDNGLVLDPNAKFSSIQERTEPAE